MLKKKIKLLIRPVLLKDCRSLWFWRNHREARRWSFHSEKIEYLTHCHWFQKVIQDHQKKIYVVCNAEGKRVGQSRFERFKNKAVISVTLNPSYYNKGIGNRLIKMVSNKYLKEFTEIKRIVAEIDQNHKASYKAFYKAGYSLQKQAVKSGKAIFILEYKQVDT